MEAVAEHIRHSYIFLVIPAKVGRNDTVFCIMQHPLMSEHA